MEYTAHMLIGTVLNSRFYQNEEDLRILFGTQSIKKCESHYYKHLSDI